MAYGSRGNAMEYRTSYSSDTPKRVREILEARLHKFDYRVRLHYGDRITGVLWGDKETGYIGRSTGQMRVPLILCNKRSSGGGAILDSSILRIEHANKRNGGTIWKADNLV